MKKYRLKIYIVFLVLITFFAGISLSPCVNIKAMETAGNKVPDELNNLYAQSAVLMDADSGRILFSKNGQKERANASTTKIMTCIVALEDGNLDDPVTITERAQNQPKVKLGVQEGEQYLLRDLLYSLMLESHNDAAVAVAEGVAGSVENFALKMNQKAKELGCMQTYFITPNGLDDTDNAGFHHTTAEDLSRIMKYCIQDSPKKSLFLEITGTSSYSFSDITGRRSFSCNNHNALLQIMEGAISGKTGFTADAGYCYVGAVKRGDRTFIVSLLACGWPNHKGYKWQDMKAIIDYAFETYHYQTIHFEPKLPKRKVINGILGSNLFESNPQMKLEAPSFQANWKLLLSENEKVECQLQIEKQIAAPVYRGDKEGQLQVWLNGELLKSYPVQAACTVRKRTYLLILKYIIFNYVLK